MFWNSAGDAETTAEFLTFIRLEQSQGIISNEIKKTIRREDGTDLTRILAEFKEDTIDAMLPKRIINLIAAFPNPPQVQSLTTWFAGALKIACNCLFDKEGYIKLEVWHAINIKSSEHPEGLLTAFIPMLISRTPSISALREEDRTEAAMNNIKRQLLISFIHGFIAEPLLQVTTAKLEYEQAFKLLQLDFVPAVNKFFSYVRGTTQISNLSSKKWQAVAVDKFKEMLIAERANTAQILAPPGNY